ncbi:MAG TPA: hypothetical protein VGS96_21475 [Thermoanaerobaculia bacterium]|jgi:hypothetical protein|nr:hypothetical protein [Thermoanaerobaculia bacterium]
MDPTSALFLANGLSFVVYLAIGFWYLAPWMRKKSRAEALAPLLWVHVFRHVALQIFAAQRAGLPVSDSLRNEIAYGDVIGMVLALVALFALRARSAVAVPIVWLFVVLTVADLLNAAVGGMRQALFGSAQGVTWLILASMFPRCG